MEDGVLVSRKWTGKLGTYTITARRSIDPKDIRGTRRRYGPPGGNVVAAPDSAGNLTFKIDEDTKVVRIIDVTVKEPHRKQGLGLELVRVLFEAMAGYDVSKEPTEFLDTDDGRDLIERARANNLHIHEASCEKPSIEAAWKCSDGCSAARRHT